MGYLFDRWEEIKSSLAPGILLLDYDGTLAPIVSRPELAILSEEMRETVRRVLRYYKTCIMSGRSLAELKRLVGINGIYYAEITDSR